jgi:hypothetical protein
MEAGVAHFEGGAMGKEIGSDGFHGGRLCALRPAPRARDAHAHKTYRAGGFANAGLVAGFELEAWLIDEHFFPVPRNVSFLQRMASPLVVPELSLFNVEINGTPQALRATALSQLEGS